MEDRGGPARIVQAFNRVVLPIAAGVAAGGQDQTAGGLSLPADVQLVQRALTAGEENLQQVALQQGEDGLALRVTEAGVVLHHLGAGRGEHQAEVEDAPEGTALGLEGRQSGEKNLVHTARGQLRRVVGGGGYGPHTAGVGPPVAVEGPLVVLAGGHGDHMLAVAEGQDGDLRAGHTLLNDQAGARLAELLVGHHAADGLLGLGCGLGHHHALAQGQAVGLHHDGRALRADVGEGGVHVRKGLIFGGGDVVALHQVLGEDLAGLNDGGVGPGAEGGDAGGLQGVHHAQGQRIVGGDHHEIDGVGGGPGRHHVHVGGLDGHALGQGGDAAVAGGAVELLHVRALGEGPDNGVFTAAAADHKNIHRGNLLMK